MRSYGVLYYYLLPKGLLEITYLTARGRREPPYHVLHECIAIKHSTLTFCLSRLSSILSLRDWKVTLLMKMYDPASEM